MKETEERQIQNRARDREGDRKEDTEKERDGERERDGF